MVRYFFKICFLLTVLIWISKIGFAQISPGELSKAHEKLEGISNCTQCHKLNEKEVPNSNCLNCHKEINSLISERKGYHSSGEVSGKQCVSCHSDHHGRNFQVIRFVDKTFDHSLTTFPLKGKHAKLSCEECHEKERIKEKISQRNTGVSYLGLNNECLNCHEDVHQGTLNNKCSLCHGFDSFMPAPLFDHQTTDYPLVGAHQKVKCDECHKKEIWNGKAFQQFSGVAYANCTDCHEDVHHGKFGNDCLKCHTMDSFHGAERSSFFNHDKTDYPLLGAHQKVDCKACHKNSLTDPLKYQHCSDCHEDYHQGQFAEKGRSDDCDACHTIDAFSPSTYTIERHNRSQFVLNGGHLATACYDCHKKDKRWEFRNVGKKCSDCHEDIHQGYIDEKYYPQRECENCHSETAWGIIAFDHDQTSYSLLGEHAVQSCRKCHYADESKGILSQRFSSLTPDCENCHTDVHLGQFKQNDKNDCLACHGYNDWKADKFDHDKTRFKLEGGHKGVACDRCHNEIKTDKGVYIKYKFEEVKCSDCHSPQE